MGTNDPHLTREQREQAKREAVASQRSRAGKKGKKKGPDKKSK